MSLESSAVKLCVSLGMAANSATPREIKSAVNTKAILGGIVMAIPLWGLETVVYAFILWSMYAKVAEIAGIKFSGSIVKNVLGGFVINLICVFILNLFLDFILIFGWIGMMVAGYLATRYSGIAYLGILEQLHGKVRMRSRLDYEAGKRTFLESGGKEAVKGVGTGMVMGEIKDVITSD